MFCRNYTIRIYDPQIRIYLYNAASPIYFRGYYIYWYPENTHMVLRCHYNIFSELMDEVRIYNRLRGCRYIVEEYSIRSIPNKTFSNSFFDKHIEIGVEEDIVKFIAGKEFYMENGIEYIRKYLITGSGARTLMYVIANLLKYDIYYNKDSWACSPYSIVFVDSLRNMPAFLPEGCVLITTDPKIAVNREFILTVSAETVRKIFHRYYPTYTDACIIHRAKLDRLYSKYQTHLSVGEILTIIHSSGDLLTKIILYSKLLREKNNYRV